MPELPASKLFRIQEREKSQQKVSLYKYREETKKIFEIIRRYCQVVEKASCDEGFMDVTREVEYLYQTVDFDFTKPWHGAVFMGFSD